MAFRSSSSTSFNGTTAFTGTAPAGVVAHDRLLAVLVQDTIRVITPPSGWAQIGNADLSGPDGHTVQLFELKDATGSDSYAFVSVAANSGILQLFAFSGRDNAATAVVAVTTNISANATPISCALTGVTASGGSDLFYGCGLDQNTNADTWGFSGLSGFTSRQDVADGIWSNLTGWTQDNISAGATGTLTATATRLTGTGAAGFGGFVVSLPAAGPVITGNPSPQVVYAGQVATFTVSATGTGALHYQWKDDGSNVGTDSSTYAPTTVFGDNGSLITCDVSDDVGTTSSGSALLTVLPSAILGWARA
jgi:hypothetical protein